MNKNAVKSFAMVLILSMSSAICTILSSFMSFGIPKFIALGIGLVLFAIDGGFLMKSLDSNLTK